MAIDDVEPTPRRFRVWGTINYSYLVREEKTHKTDETVEADSDDEAQKLVLDMAESALPLPHDADDLEMEWDWDMKSEEIEPPPPPGEDVNMRLLGMPALFPEVYADAR